MTDTSRAFTDYLESRRERVDRALDQILPPPDRQPAVIHEAMRYTVFAGGKRLRPALCLLSSLAAGGTEEEAMPAACAVEMIHAFSLIHDDLPGMDNDDLRRGKPTNHKVFGEGMAILAGDGLLTHAFQALTTLPRASAIAEATRVLAEAVGTSGLIGGQVEDLLGENGVPTPGAVERIHRMKTGSLFAGCCRLGVLAAGGSREVFERLTRYALLLGLAFQVMDDVLDETSGSEVLGKTAGKDRKEGKMTWPALVGLQASIAKARALADEARELVVGLPMEMELAGLTVKVVERTH
jgi:geranylgeranyl diphosphate synthase, type II